MKLIQLVTSIIVICVLSSCTEPQKKNQIEQAEIPEPDKNHLGVAPDKKQLDPKLFGEWINTALLDSTLTQKKLTPWLTSFYGDIYLKIDQTDTIDIEGNMDGAKTKVLIESPFQFKMPGRTDMPVFIYKREQDRIIETDSEGQQIIFRRKRNTDDITFMADEEKFNDFLLKKIFECNYIEVINSDSVRLTIKNKSFIGDPKKTKIERLWNGFETHTPFDFDAILLKEMGKKEPEYFGWEFSGDTLKLYSTTNKFDEESGFAEYKKAGLYRKLIKQK